MGQVTRLGGEVRRPTGPWTPAVHRLLTHCRSRGLNEVPEPYEVLPDGRERLQFLEGEVPRYPLPSWVWSPAVLDASTRLLRRFHDVSATADRTGPWRSATHHPVEVICHNDVAPYNLVFVDQLPVGLIDVDFASPGPRVWDVAYLAYQIVPFTTDRADGYSDAEREHRFTRLLDRYGSGVEPGHTRRTIRIRLLELAQFSEQMALDLGRPELAEHAHRYRRDAEQPILDQD